MDFSKYGNEVQKIAFEVRDALHGAEKRYRDAEELRNRYPMRTGTREYLAKAAQYEADYQEAVAARKQIMDDAPRKAENKIYELRKNLEAEIEDAFSADPSKLDMGTLELLKSGILKPSEYNRLMQSAIESDNWTMARMISHYAEEAAKTAESTDRAALNHVRQIGDGAGSRAYLSTFDALIDVVQRSMNHPALFDEWDKTGAQLIEMLGD